MINKPPPSKGLYRDYGVILWFLGILEKKMETTN